MYGSARDREFLAATRTAQEGGGAPDAFLLDEVPSLVPAVGTRVLVVTGAHPERHSRLLDGLAAAGLVTAIPAPLTEPSVDDARAAAEQARASDVVLGVGGGRVLDCAEPSPGCGRAIRSS